MIFLSTFHDLGISEYSLKRDDKTVEWIPIDETWIIVRSLKDTSVLTRYLNIKWVPELSPSENLFHKYLQWKNDGQWNTNTFNDKYVPEFINDMLSQKATLNYLYRLASTKNILLICFCPEEELCHRSIIGGIMEGSGIQVFSKYNDGRYKRFFNMYELARKRQISHTVCFTGHRPKDLFGYDHDKYIPLVNATKAVIRGLVDKGFTRFINGGAQGFDQLAFWAVNAIKKEIPQIQNIVYVPFEGQSSAWKQIGLFSQQEYQLMLNLADEVRYLYSVDRTNKKQVADALKLRNHDMVRDSYLTVALYKNGLSWQDANLSSGSGTAECMRYANSNGNLMIQINPFTFQQECFKPQKPKWGNEVIN